MLSGSLLCVLSVLTQVDAPVSAEAAIWRARLAERVVSASPNTPAFFFFFLPAALVNDEEVSVGMVLFRYQSYLEQANVKLAGEEFAQLIRGLLERDLTQAVDRVLLAQAALQRLTPAQRAELTSRWDQVSFDEVLLPKLARELQSRNRRVDERMLDHYRRIGYKNSLAQEYLLTRVEVSKVRRC